MKHRTQVQGFVVVAAAVAVLCLAAEFEQLFAVVLAEVPAVVVVGQLRHHCSCCFVVSAFFLLLCYVQPFEECIIKLLIYLCAD